MRRSTGLSVVSAGALSSPVDHLVGQVATSRANPHARRLAQPEEQVRVSESVGVVLLDAVGVLVEQAVHDVGRLTALAVITFTANRGP